MCRKSEWIRELSLNASIVFSQRESFVLIIRVWARGKLEARRGTDLPVRLWSLGPASRDIPVCMRARIRRSGAGSARIFVIVSFNLTRD